ncbi:MAG: Uma2 family endonuclease [Geminicoccaceae bacterium]|nr:Uma2 family endonuclease [Geminicoccaceae bacterium]
MTVEAFLDWVRARPEGERWELIEGVPVPKHGPEPEHAMAPESVRHGRIKRRIDQALGDGIRTRGLPCEALARALPPSGLLERSSSGPQVRVDATTTFEPDALVTCADVPDGLLVPQPVIVVEVLSPTTRERDFSIKLAGYASLSSVLHYLLVETERRLIVHHHRTDGTKDFQTSIVRGGTLGLDPPGLSLDVDAIYAGLVR